MQGMFDIFVDAVFLYGTHKTIDYLLEHGVNVYQYILTYYNYLFSRCLSLLPPVFFMRMT